MHTNLWRDLFIPGLPVIDKILRAVTVYFFLVVALKLAGKRQLAHLNSFDLIVLLTIANTVQDAIIGHDDSVTGGLIGAATLLVVNYLSVCMMYVYSKTHRRGFDAGEVLMEGGRVRRELLKKELITMAELKEAASRQGFASLDNVERAELNADGTFAFIAKRQQSETEEYQAILGRLDGLAPQIAQLQHPARPQEP